MNHIKRNKNKSCNSKIEKFAMGGVAKIRLGCTNKSIKEQKK